jgi:hypothetical protein
MDAENQIFVDSNSKKNKNSDIIEITKLKVINLENHNKKFYFFISIMIFIFFAILFNLSSINNNSSGVDLSEVTFQKLNKSILQEIKKLQMEFCSNQSKYIKYNFENQIKLVNASLLKKNFYMYI